MTKLQRHWPLILWFWHPLDSQFLLCVFREYGWDVYDIILIPVVIFQDLLNVILVYQRINFSNDCTKKINVKNEFFFFPWVELCWRVYRILIQQLSHLVRLFNKSQHILLEVCWVSKLKSRKCLTLWILNFNNLLLNIILSKYIVLGIRLVKYLENMHDLKLLLYMKVDKLSFLERDF
jgi:hypothetical protein